MYPKQRMATTDEGRLVVFVFQVWQYCERMNWNITKEHIYGLYNGSLSGKTAETVPGGWDFDIAQLKADYRQWVAAQNPPEFIAQMLIMEQSGNVEFHSLAQTLAGHAVRERVYINPKMNYALPVMRYIVQHIVLPGHVLYAKIAKDGPGCESVYDRIVLYCADEASAMFAKNLIALQFDCGHFNSATPALTKVLSEGISMGSEPRQQGLKKIESFGQKRASIIWEALRRCNQDPDLLLEEVIKACRRHNVDPDHPHQNWPG
jgi:HopA1 effector protein family